MRLQQLNDHDAEQQKQFSEYLIRIGEGREPVIKDLGEDIIRLPDEICLPNYHTPDLIDFVYDRMESNHLKNDYFLDRAILCTKNITVDRLNNDILNRLPGAKKLTTA
jgi:hypothetical protein